jgi:hypothetical protein
MAALLGLMQAEAVKIFLHKSPADVRLQRGKQLLAKLNAAVDEKKALEWQLQQHDAVMTQLELTRRQLGEVTAAYNQMHAQCVSLRAQTEDLVTHVASLKKVRADQCSCPCSCSITWWMIELQSSARQYFSQSRHTIISWVACQAFRCNNCLR